MFDFGNRGMLPTTDLPAEALGEFLAAEMNRRCGASHPRLTELVPFAAQLALECIANSDALYHNVEHTMLVTLAGHDIFVGRALLTQSTPSDYAHLIIACLMHDIGYVRGILKGDGIDGYVIDAHGRKVALPRGSSDAALMPYHVDRSKLFVLDRMHELDAERIARSIELTRFPVTSVNARDDLEEEGLLVRAADLIGQLGDPHYLRKANALFCEFEEIGMNKKLGYDSPADIIDKYPQFYWNMISPHVEGAIRYLNVTARGRQWIANLYSNVFRAERDVRLSGPQP
jgi:hypothetical protein